MSEEWGGKGSVSLCAWAGERGREVCVRASVSNAEWKPGSRGENKGRRLSGDCVRTSNVYL